VDHSDDRMQKKIRTHTTGKVPFLLLAGEKDLTANAVSFRFRDGTQVNGVPVGQAVDAIDGWIRSRSNTSPTAEAFAYLVPPVAEPVPVPERSGA
jgi:threonyl-tRNA synthetase